MEIVLIAICIIYLLGVLFTLSVLLYSDYKFRKSNVTSGLELKNSTIIISSIFWIGYWRRYYLVCKFTKHLKEFYEELYKNIKEEDKK